MTREEMLNEMIRIYGFEHEVVIQFAHAMESPYISDETLRLILKLHRLFPVKEEEEEEEETEEYEIDELDLCSYNPYTGEIVAEEYEKEE